MESDFGEVCPKCHSLLSRKYIGGGDDMNGSWPSTLTTYCPRCGWDEWAFFSGSSCEYGGLAIVAVLCGIVIFAAHHI